MTLFVPQVFKYSLFLVLLNRLTSCAVAVFMLVVSKPWLQACFGYTGLHVNRIFPLPTSI